MKKIRIALLAAMSCALLAPLVRAQSISINASISGQIVPGVYGQVTLGGRPPPPVVYAQPVIVQPAPVVVGAPPVEPIYLHVPPGHAKHWKEHCHEYHACNRPVYFVKSAEYEPGYRPEKEHGHHND
jgi:hypothetical protein